MAQAKIEVVLSSSFARFVRADIKGGEYAKAFRVETISHALEQLFKGNYDPIREASTLTEGKAKKARAYAAGFATLGKVGEDVKKVDYTGALNSKDNAQARERIASLTKHHTANFFVAFDAVMAEKAEKKAPKADSNKAEKAEAVRDAEMGAAVSPIQQPDGLADMARTVARAIQTGLLDAESMAAIVAALEACDAVEVAVAA